MLQKFPFKWAVNISLVLLSLLTVFHALILTGLIPFDMIWGSHLQTKEEMFDFEMMALSINLFIILVIATKVEYVKINVPKKTITVALWLCVVLFSMNTLANLFSKNSIEIVVFTPLSIISAVLCLRIVKEKQA